MQLQLLRPAYSYYTPLKKYLANASWDLVRYGGKDWKNGLELVLFAIGQVFVAASSGFFKILLYETWLGDVD